MLLEGTHVRDAGQGINGPSERDVELAMAETFRTAKGLGVVFSSAQNIDRLVTIYRACKRARRTLVVDLYTAAIATSTAHRTIPQPGHPNLRIYVPNRQRILVKTSREFDRVEAIRRHRVFLAEIRERAAEMVMVIQGSTLPELARANCLDGAVAIWSLWPGYLDRSSGKRTTRRLRGERVPLVHLHASGHARIEDLQALARAMAPARVAPIHTAAPEQFDRLFDRVEVHDDGLWWEV